MCISAPSVSLVPGRPEEEVESPRTGVMNHQKPPWAYGL